MTDAPLDRVMAAVPEPMLFIAADGSIETSNEAAAALFGTRIVGRSFAAVLRQPALLDRIEATQAGGPASEARFQLADQAGETVFRVRVTPVPSGDILPVPTLLHFTDISHLREAEDMRRDFVANVNHELRTPLTAVLGFIETLRGPAKDDPGAQERFLGIMEDEARRMNRLVSDLLSLSKVEGEERIRPSDQADLTAVLQGVMAALRPAADDNGNTLVFEDTLPDGAGTALVKGDPDQLTQVFLNLAENAVKYGGPDRPITLKLSGEEGSGTLRGPLLRVDVIDQGEGIDSLHLPRLTERFYRIDTHRSRAMGGTGLGLAIVKHIVNRHRGRLRVVSNKGEWTTFSVLLPVN